MRITPGLPIQLSASQMKQSNESDEGKFTITQENRKYMSDSIVSHYQKMLSIAEPLVNKPYDGDVRDAKYTVSVKGELTAVVQQNGIVYFHGEYGKGLALTNEGAPSISFIENRLINQYGQGNVSVEQYSDGDSPTKQELSGLNSSQYMARYRGAKALAIQDIANLKAAIQREQSQLLAYA
jgi:hypothetical protein